MGKCFAPDYLVCDTFGVRENIVEKCVLLIENCVQHVKNVLLTLRLAHVILKCRSLRELDLQENEVEDHKGQWLSCFPESCTSLVSLNFACLKGEINLGALERLVARSPNLKSLRLNRSVPVDALQKILMRAPQLVDLGIGSFFHDLNSDTYAKLKATILKCKSITSLSGFLEVAPFSLAAIYPISQNLTSLNLSYAAGIQSSELIKLIRHCGKLQRLWVTISSLKCLPFTC